MNRSLFAAAFLLPVFGFAATVFDPGAGPVALRVNQSDNRQQSVTASESPDGRPMLHAKWNCAAANYLEFSLSQPVALPEFRDGELAVDVFVPDNAAIGKFNLRVTDSQGETLQYQLPNDQLKPGRQTIRCRLTDTNRNSWGAQKNGKIDFPARVTGMSIDFNRKEGDGELWIGKVDFTPTAFDAGELLADTATAPVIVGQAAARGQSATVEEAGGRQARRLNWDAAKARWLEFSFRNPLPPIDEFDSARFDVELLIPENFEGRRVNLRLADKSGETFQFALPTEGLTPGWHTVQLRISKSGAPNRGVWGGDQNRQLDFPVRVSGISVDYPAGSGAGTVALGTIRIAR